VEFVKTKNHCYLVKELANVGSLAELLLYRSQLGMERNLLFQGKLTETEMQMVVRGLLRAISDLYVSGLCLWDLRPETIMLNIGQKFEDAGGTSATDQL
jgi:serine/threonine protein kinase